jgi:Fic family protein
MGSPVGYHVGKFPPQHLDWSRLIPLLGPASAALARYDGLLTAIPNSAVLLSPMTTQEAVLSSKIEGTQATMGEVLEYEAAGAGERIDPRKEADIEEVLNYRKAMRQAEEMLQKLPLCNRLLKDLHETLLSGVRGHDKARGRFRTIQNYIAPPGAPIEKARFIPVAPEDVEAGMSRWEKYLHEDTPDRLVQLAIVHAEFESLHPFLDGNGRIGRMMLPLFLFDQKLLHAPMFYLSEYLEPNRQGYYDRLLAVSRDDEWTGWCQFFLEALIRQANQNEAKVRQILELYQRRKEWVVTKTHSQHAIRALDFLFRSPIFTSTNFIEGAKIPAPSARRILNILSQNRLLKTLRRSSGQRPATFAFSELLNITEGRKAF